MARLTDDGHIISSGPQMVGLHISWQELNAWLRGELPDQRKRWIRITHHHSGGGGGGHGSGWDDGYAIGKRNAYLQIRRELGIHGVPPLHPEPAKGTDQRHGYEAAQLAAKIAVAAITPD